MTSRQPKGGGRPAVALATVLAIAFGLLVLAVRPSSAAPGILYAATGGAFASDLYTIDPATGVATTVGPIGFAVTGLAQDPTTGILYGVTTAQDPMRSSLIIVNPVTGAGTLVGPEGPCCDVVADIAFNAAGQLYGWGQGPDDLVTIDKATGLATVVGDAAIGTFGDGMAFNASGVLYYLNGDDTLNTVDPATGAVTFVANTSPSAPGTSPSAASFSCDGATLFALHQPFGGGVNGSVPSTLITVDTLTGAVTTIGPTVARGDALGWVCPLPGGGGGGGTGDDGEDGDDGGSSSGPQARITIVEDAPAHNVSAMSGVRRGRVVFGYHTKDLKLENFGLETGAKRDFKHLKPGTYTVAQNKKDGWTLDKIVCKDPSKNTKVNVGNRRAVIKLKADEHVTCTFTNKAKPTK